MNGLPTEARIPDCNACPRLRAYCAGIARERRRAYAGQVYWGRPVPGFGDRRARLLVVGLAPGAHGANRTGRVFTGDRSGEWLYRALYRAGFANHPESRGPGDGLELRDAYVTCVVKCAPPDNKPAPDELERCGELHFADELAELKRVSVFLVLGQIALAGLWTRLHRGAQSHAPGARPPARPRFAHGAGVTLADNRRLLMSYHPSQQNTFTGRLTEPMFDAVFAEARRLLSLHP